ncbi:hypothetical protein MJG53_010576 [Ovis ammon polii x Ovis aries]|uniref:Uncharacterized protein n=1 Tax=Ovis ammon polii x Ovis aries TaxID=2918886 RepID=A0ACB9UUK4_9CETA|nr:hypothetical protein MJG53_010576 [Ovis ammon polii x Ovis aries]
MAGGLVSADKESAAHILSRKESINLLSILVGGIQEALNARPGAYKLVLLNRKGFIRLDLMHGYWGEGSKFSWRLARIVFLWDTPEIKADSILAALMPIFSFGENDIFDQVENSPGSWLRWFQDRLHKRTRGSILLFYGRGIFQFSFGLMPCHRPITTVVEKPIEVQKTLHRSQEEVDRLHQRYMQELENLFEAHKLKNNVSID